MIWGPYELFGPRVPAFAGAVRIMGRRFPEYNFVVLAAALVLLGGLWVIFNKTLWGVKLRAATQDREMIAALGVDQRWVVLRRIRAGSGARRVGGRASNSTAAGAYRMDLDIVIQAFAVIVIGGMGSIKGTFLASILVGVITAVGAVVLSESSLVMVFILMAAVLVVRPNGLLGKNLGHDWKDPTGAPAPPRRAGPRLRLAWTSFAVLLAAAPFYAGTYGLGVVSETLIYALFAFSFYFMAGPAGMISFGQAAFFAVGMYAAAVLSRASPSPDSAASRRRSCCNAGFPCTSSSRRRRSCGPAVASCWGRTRWG